MNTEELLKENASHPIGFMGKYICFKFGFWLVWEYDLNARYVELYRGDSFDTAFSILAGKVGEP